MTVYVDTSVLVAGFTEDAQTERATAWLRTGPALLVSSWTGAEFSAAVRRKALRGELDDDGMAAAECMMNRLLRNPAAFRPVVPADIEEARILVCRCPPLRAPDALHLAVTRRLAVPLATLDGGLRKAAVACAADVVDL